MQIPFTTKCQLCPRLSNFLADVKRQNPDYYAQPVPSFGCENPKLLIVGLAPGMHGANRTGRPFTGDYAGILLYKTLHKFGFASKNESIQANDGLELLGCRITNAVRCLPPQNKPDSNEITMCNNYLRDEIEILDKNSILIALGNIAHQAILKASGLKTKDGKFAHNARHNLPNGRVLIDSYHCSRYNTQTKRLSPEMFESVFEHACNILNERT